MKAFSGNLIYSVIVLAIVKIGPLPLPRSDSKLPITCSYPESLNNLQTFPVTQLHPPPLIDNFLISAADVRDS